MSLPDLPVVPGSSDQASIIRFISATGNISNEIPVPVLPCMTDVKPVLIIPTDHPSRPCRAIFLLALALLLVPQGAPAHSPSDMQLAFDQGNRILSVTITHTVADPSTHYIKRVLVTTGGSPLSDTAYTSQPSPQTFTYTYLVPEGVNGDIQVRAECSILGSITRSLQIQGASPGVATSPQGRPPVPPAAPGTNRPSATNAAGSPPAAPSATPTEAGPGLLPLAAAMALAVWRFRR